MARLRGSPLRSLHDITPHSAIVLVNPLAGAGRAKSAVSRVAAYFKTQNFSADFVEPRGPGELEHTAREAIAHGGRLVVTLGGDGTFQCVANAALGSDATLGLLPSGGGNDFAAALGIPGDPVAAAHALLHGTPRAVDVLRARTSDGRTRCYVGGGGLGLDAETGRLASRRFRALPGAVRYVVSALWALASFEPLEVQADLDGGSQHVRSRVLFAAVANTPSYGAGVRIAPDARVDDGLLNLVLVGALSVPQVLDLIPRILRTGDLRRPEIRRFTARRVRLQAARPAVFHGDGEILGDAPVEIEVLPAALRVLAPASDAQR
ncbi:MAG TPA: diacylglycerol kinase family protein [Candidatus Acidoferrales bacterium]|nr:diacylglycerol kinase family protein [Candidatus Acidoferrales bacterium]